MSYKIISRASDDNALFILYGTVLKSSSLKLFLGIRYAQFDSSLSSLSTDDYDYLTRNYFAISTHNS